MKLEDVRQGKEGDCFILSCVSAILSSLGELYISTIINEKETDNIEFNYYIKKT